MSQLRISSELISVAEYLEGEALAQVRHEFVDGRVFAMAGASDRHNLVAGNLFAALHTHLRGKPCQTFQSDMKVRIKTDRGERFYYPDVLVSCENNEKHPYYRDSPRVVIEVLSDTTWRTDWREKLPAYQNIPSVEEIVLISPDWAEVNVYRRAENWQRETLTKNGEILHLKSLTFSLPLGEVYERLTLSKQGPPWYLLGA